ncbi:MAG: CaiB/BaiF CoA-transferase family protein [Novosphingobium sp.]|nr:CaiB/BaiF CoA-transferase family protein [Novosphingobium sp.]
MAGALEGITVVELASIGPGPFAAMMLADHGARVIRVERPGVPAQGAFGRHDVMNRNREFVELDLKSEEGLAQLRELIDKSDVLIEGLRPGALERLGLAPDDLLASNPKLVIGRMTGWGQEGPKAKWAGHDINYIALSGALHTYGRKDQKPTPPSNAVGDYGGGGMMMAFGLLAGILSARTSGKGQVVDCAMLDGAALLTTVTYMMHAIGMWQDERGVNVLDTGAPYYETYETSDGKYVSIGPIEEPFYHQMLAVLGLSDDSEFLDRENKSNWPALIQRLEAIFLTKTRDEWCALMEDSDICFAPVLSLSEAPSHPHNVARGTFIEVDGVVQPAPAPRFSGTPAPPVRMPKA